MPREEAADLKNIAKLSPRLSEIMRSKPELDSGEPFFLGDNGNTVFLSCAEGRDPIPVCFLLDPCPKTPGCVLRAGEDITFPCAGVSMRWPCGCMCVCKEIPSSLTGGEPLETDKMAQIVDDMMREACSELLAFRKNLGGN